MPRPRRPSISGLILRILLGGCWLQAMTMTAKWMIPENENNGDGERRHADPTGEPPREVRPQLIMADIEAETDAPWGFNREGAEGRDEPTKFTGEEPPSPSPSTAAAIAVSGDEDSIDHNAPINKTQFLVEALRPITSEECCIPNFSLDKPKKDVDCFGACFNERACNDPIYPFQSQDEKDMLPSVNGQAMPHHGELRRLCKKPNPMRPPVEWCQKPHVEDGTGAPHLVNGIPPAGCSQTTIVGGTGAFHHVILFPSAKLAFCGIPKVGITQWEQFLRFYLGAKDYPSLPHRKLDRKPFQFDLLEPAAQRRIWEDEEWTWAAFVRDPAERLLSGYLDRVTDLYERQKIKYLLTFEDFVESLSSTMNFTGCSDNPFGNSFITGLHWCSDPHWRPQIYSCGLSERIDRFQFIGNIHHAADHTRQLLDHVGLWESHGKHFINGGVKMSPDACKIASHPYNHTEHVGFQQQDVVTNKSAAQTAYGHSKGSKSKMEEYYTPDLLKRVQEELYPDDYKLFTMVKEDGFKLSKGVELASRLSKNCHGNHVVMPLP